MNDPLDLEAKILDMQAKTKYINAKIEEHVRKNEKEKGEAKLEKLEK
jgi:hypothetical protein